MLATAKMAGRLAGIASGYAVVARRQTRRDAEVLAARISGISGSTATVWGPNEMPQAYIAACEAGNLAHNSLGGNFGGDPPTLSSQLMEAVKYGRISLVRALVEQGADVDDTTTNPKFTPLGLAARDGNLEMVRVLLEVGASLEKTANEALGVTPLCLAAIGENAEVARVLLEAGANKWVTIGGATTLMALAQRQGNPKILEVLSNTNAKPDEPEPDPNSTGAEGGAVELSGASLVGKRVVAHGLNSRGDANGRRGIALSFNSATGRYVVRFDNSLKNAKLKPANLINDLTSKRVVAHSLSHEELNGCHGFVLSFDPGIMRYVVRLDKDGKRAKLKPANIRRDVTQSLSAATEWYPLEALRSAVSDAVDPEVTVAPQVLADAQERLRVLATRALEAAMNTRQVQTIRQAMAAAKAEGLVCAEAMADARALIAVLEIERPGAELAPAGTHATDELTRPAHIDASVVLAPFVRCASKSTVAVNDFKYWGGDAQPWRNGLDDSAVTDQSVIASEERHKLSAEAEDQETAGSPAHAAKLRNCGVRIDFLLALTFEFDMWDWKTWEVVQHLVKPLTETKGRCRFADLAGVRPFTGAATIFLSHCWGGRWGDLVAAACAGADTRRIVW